MRGLGPGVSSCHVDAGTTMRVRLETRVRGTSSEAGSALALGRWGLDLCAIDHHPLSNAHGCQVGNIGWKWGRKANANGKMAGQRLQ